MDATNSSADHTAAEAAKLVSEHAAGIVAAPSYDEPYRFGRRPTSRAPFPFTEREFARLLIARSRIHAQTFSLAEAEA